MNNIDVGFKPSQQFHNLAVPKLSSRNSLKPNRQSEISLSSFSPTSPAVATTVCFRSIGTQGQFTLPVRAIDEGSSNTSQKSEINRDATSQTSDNNKTQNINNNNNNDQNIHKLKNVPSLVNIKKKSKKSKSFDQEEPSKDQQTVHKKSQSMNLLQNNSQKKNSNQSKINLITPSQLPMMLISTGSMPANQLPGPFLSLNKPLGSSDSDTGSLKSSIRFPTSQGADNQTNNNNHNAFFQSLSSSSPLYPENSLHSHPLQINQRSETSSRSAGSNNSSRYNTPSKNRYPNTGAPFLIPLNHGNLQSSSSSSSSNHSDSLRDDESYSNLSLASVHTSRSDSSVRTANLPLQCYPPPPKLYRDKLGRYYCYFPNPLMLSNDGTVHPEASRDVMNLPPPLPVGRFAAGAGGGLGGAGGNFTPPINRAAAAFQNLAVLQSIGPGGDLASISNLQQQLEAHYKQKGQSSGSASSNSPSLGSFQSNSRYNAHRRYESESSPAVVSSFADLQGSANSSRRSIRRLSTSSINQPANLTAPNNSSLSYLNLLNHNSQYQHNNNSNNNNPNQPLPALLPDAFVEAETKKKDHKNKNKSKDKSISSLAESSKLSHKSKHSLVDILSKSSDKAVVEQKADDLEAKKSNPNSSKPKILQHFYKSSKSSNKALQEEKPINTNKTSSNKSGLPTKKASQSALTAITGSSHLQEQQQQPHFGVRNSSLNSSIKPKNGAAFQATSHHSSNSNSTAATSHVSGENNTAGITTNDDAASAPIMPKAKKPSKPSSSASAIAKQERRNRRLYKLLNKDLPPLPPEAHMENNAPPNPDILINGSKPSKTVPIITTNTTTPVITVNDETDPLKSDDDFKLNSTTTVNNDEFDTELTQRSSRGQHLSASLQHYPTKKEVELHRKKKKSRPRPPSRFSYQYTNYSPSQSEDSEAYYSEDDKEEDLKFNDKTASGTNLTSALSPPNLSPSQEQSTLSSCFSRKNNNNNDSIDNNNKLTLDGAELNQTVVACKVVESQSSESTEKKLVQDKVRQHHNDETRDEEELAKTEEPSSLPINQSNTKHDHHRKTSSVAISNININNNTNHNNNINHINNDIKKHTRQNSSFSGSFSSQMIHSNKVQPEVVVDRFLKQTSYNEFNETKTNLNIEG